MKNIMKLRKIKSKIILFYIFPTVCILQLDDNEIDIDVKNIVD